MRSMFKLAAVFLALSPAMAVPALASAPISHAEKAARVLPAAADETPGAYLRVARYSATMSDGDEEFRPRRKVTRKAYRPARQARRTGTRQARRSVVARQQPRKAVNAAQAPAAAKPARTVAVVPVGRADNGVASYYWQGQRVASGAVFNPNGMTAAHKTLPFGTKVRVTHMGNGRTVDVTINDRGPFIAGRIIDLSRGAASVIGMTGQGLARVKMEVLGR